jgi:ribosomal protein L17
MTERLQKKVRPSKKTLTELLNDKSVVTGREVVQRIKDKEKLRKQFDEAVEFEVRNGKGKK